jgi:hypothetical protein
MYRNRQLHDQPEQNLLVTMRFFIQLKSQNSCSQSAADKKNRTYLCGVDHGKNQAAVSKSKKPVMLDSVKAAAVVHPTVNAIIHCSTTCKPFYKLFIPMSQTMDCFRDTDFAALYHKTPLVVSNAIITVLI